MRCVAFYQITIFPFHLAFLFTYFLSISYLFIYLFILLFILFYLFIYLFILFIYLFIWGFFFFFADDMSCGKVKKRLRNGWLIFTEKIGYRATDGNSGQIQWLNEKDKKPVRFHIRLHRKR